MRGFSVLEVILAVAFLIILKWLKQTQKMREHTADEQMRIRV